MLMSFVAVKYSSEYVDNSRAPDPRLSTRNVPSLFVRTIDGSSVNPYLTDLEIRLWLVRISTSGTGDPFSSRTTPSSGSPYRKTVTAVPARNWSGEEPHAPMLPDSITNFGCQI